MPEKINVKLAASGYLTKYKTGIGGIKTEHHKMIKLNDSHSAIGSMDIDSACKESHPNSARWDYLITIHKINGENLAFIEVHGATPKEVDTMIKKKKWLETWLNEIGLIKFPKAFIWIASGKMAITPHSRYSKNLAKWGLTMPVRETRLLDIEVEYK